MPDKIAIQTITSQELDKLSAYCPAYTPLQQTVAYVQTLETLIPSAIEYQIFKFTNNNTPIGHCIIMKRRVFKLWSLQSILRGPVWYDDLSDTTIEICLNQLFNAINHPRRLLITPLGLSTQNILKKKFGWRTVASADSTMTINVKQPLDDIRANFDKDWRYSLRQSEATSLSVKNNTNLETLQFLVQQEKKQQNQYGYFRPLPRSFERSLFEHYKDKSVVCLTTEHQSDLCASMMFLLAGTTAHYHIGWSNDKGRDLYAHNLLLWRAIELFHDTGLKTLDMGGVDTVNTPGIARFKLGMQGDVKTFGASMMPPLIQSYKKLV